MAFAGQRFFCLLFLHSCISPSLLPVSSSALSVSIHSSICLSLQVSLPDLSHATGRISSPPPSLLPLPHTSLTLWLSLILTCLGSDRVRKFCLSVASSCSNFNIWGFLKLLTEEYYEVQQKDSYLRSDIIISTPHKARNYFNYTKWSIAQLVLFKELLNCLNTQFRNLKRKTQKLFCKAKSTTTASNRWNSWYLSIIKCTQLVK